MKQPNLLSSRREFIGTLAAAGAASILTAPGSLAATPLQPTVDAQDAEEWLKKIKGKHRIIYDAPEPHDGFPIIWSWVFYQTNNQTGTPDAELTAVVVLRHNAIGLAMEDRLWTKYKFGETFKVTDSMTSAAAVRNPYYVPTDQMWVGNGIQGIKALQERGVLFCVCDMALTVYSGMIAKGMNLKAEDVKKDWVSGLLPGIQIVPSGVWAISRVQEKGCAYCYAGG
jgi:intracellular sulfur oxidation DsrE/DsrF family protein